MTTSANSKTINPSAEWRKMHDKYYRKVELFTLSWQHVDLTQVLDHKMIVAVAPFGGPIAMVRDDTKKAVRAPISTAHPFPVIRIFKSSGVPLSEFAVGDDQIKPLKLGWTNKEELVCVMDNGTVSIFNVFGEILNSFDLGKEVRLNGIQDVIVYGVGMVVLMCNKQIVAINNFDIPIPTLLANVETSDEILSMTVIDPSFTASERVEVFLSTSGGTIIVVNESQAIDQMTTQNAFKLMSVSPNGKILAGFTTDGKLRVLLTNFSKNLSEVDFQTKVLPAQLVWCGVDAVVIYWRSKKEHILMMVGPYEDTIKHIYEEPLVLVPEVDGVRVFSNFKCEFLQLVPKCLEDIFKFGSMADSAILYDAWKQFESKNSKADENIRSIQAGLSEAVDACVTAAGNEFNVELQKDLLHSASYGKCSCDWYTSDAFVDMCRNIRVLNMVRRPEIGRPLSLRQYETLTVETLIAHLINQHHHLVALNICKYLKLGNQIEKMILVHWACAKIRGSDPQSDSSVIHEMIVSKLRPCNGVSFAEVASTAHDYGHNQLALSILHCEPKSSEQVPLLIGWNKDELALTKAIESGDTDLVYLCLLHMKDAIDKTKETMKDSMKDNAYDDFFRIVASHPLACNLLIAFCKEMDLKALQSFFYSTNRMDDAGNVLIREAYKKDNLPERLNGLEIAIKFFEKSKNGLFAKTATLEQIKLLKIQVDLTIDTNKPFVDLSLSDTIFYCYEFGLDKKANDLVKEFKVPEKRLWHLKTKALAHFKKFDELEKFANSKKSPIGYQPFFDACLEQGQTGEAEKYVMKLPDATAKVNAYVKLKKFDHALDIAISSKDSNLIQFAEQEKERKR